MKLFKLKSFERDGLLHILDMIVYERLYLSTYHPMNDVDEGSWAYGSEPTAQYIESSRLVREIVDKVRFTSFIESINNPLMWAHYAGGFSGIALEYDLNPESLDIRKIEYTGKPKVTREQQEQIIEAEILPQDAGILRSKEKCWEYEDEWRLYGNSDKQYILNTKPCSIIFGITSSPHFQVLKKIAVHFGLRKGYLNPTNGSGYEIIYI
jgi:hypothetical protein